VGTPVTLAFSGGSGTGAVTFAVTDPGTAGCTISSGTLNAATAGTCTVTVTKAADASYKVASSTATTVTFIGAVVPPSKPPKIAPAIPHALTVKFTKTSVGLTANYKRALNVLAKKLVGGAAVTVTCYTKTQSALAKARAKLTVKFLRSRARFAIAINMHQVKKKAPQKVVVIPTRN